MDTESEALAALGFPNVSLPAGMTPAMFVAGWEAYVDREDQEWTFSAEVLIEIWSAMELARQGHRPSPT